MPDTVNLSQGPWLSGSQSLGLKFASVDLLMYHVVKLFSKCLFLMFSIFFRDISFYNEY